MFGHLLMHFTLAPVLKLSKERPLCELVMLRETSVCVWSPAHDFYTSSCSESVRTRLLCELVRIRETGVCVWVTTLAFYTHSVLKQLELCSFYKLVRLRETSVCVWLSAPAFYTSYCSESIRKALSWSVT